MNRVSAYLTGIGASAFSTLAAAHPGHEHGTWFSDVLHLVTVLALVGAGAVGVSLYRRRRNKSNAASTEKSEG